MEFYKTNYLLVDKYIGLDQKVLSWNFVASDENWP